MKRLQTICFMLTIVTFLGLNGAAQDSVLLKTAQDDFAKGLELYNQKDYKNSINYLLNSDRLFPHAVTYYVLCNDYCQSFDFRNAKFYAEAALNFRNPRLAPKFIPDAEKIRDFAIDRLTPHNETQVTGVTAQTMISIPKGITPTADENPYIPRKKVMVKTISAVPVHLIRSNGQITIRQTYVCDLDNGNESNLTVGDFWWEYQTQTIRYLTPENGARFHILRTTDFDAIDYAYLKSIPADQFSGEKMPGFKSSVYSALQLSPEIVIAYITNEGRLGKMRIINLDSNSLPIQWVTYEN